MGVEEQKIAGFLTYYSNRRQYFISLDEARVNLSIPIGGYKDMGDLEEKKD